MKHRLLKLSKATFTVLLSVTLTATFVGTINLANAEEQNNGWIPYGEDIYFSGGKVGIGTDGPTSSLDVKNGRITVSHSGWSPGLVLKDDEDNDSFALLHHRAGDRFSIFNKNGEAKFVLQQSGNIGIGTVNPSEALHVDNGRIMVSHSSQAPSITLRDNLDDDTFSMLHNRSGNRLEFRNKDNKAKIIIFQNGAVCIGNCL